MLNFWTDLPECPYCGEEDQDWGDGLPLKNDGDSWDTECGNCDERYTVALCLTATFSTKKLKEKA